MLESEKRSKDGVIRTLSRDDRRAEFGPKAELEWLLGPGPSRFDHGLRWRLHGKLGIVIISCSIRRDGRELEQSSSVNAVGRHSLVSTRRPFGRCKRGFRACLRAHPKEHHHETQASD